MVRGHPGPTDPADPDFAVHSAWLARLADVDHTAVDNIDSEEAEKGDDGGSADAGVNIPPRSPLGTRSRAVRLGLTGLAFALAAVIVNVLLQHLSSENSRQPVGRTAEMTSLDRLSRDESARPELIVESSRAVAGEPAPLGIALRGGADEDGAVIITGLIPGMELSAGRSMANASWQLSAKDLPLAWIAPPPNFVGSADLVAELRLSNDEIADRRAIHLEWMAPISPAPARPERDRESIPQLQPDRQDVQSAIIDTPRVEFSPLPQGGAPSTAAKGTPAESRMEPETTNSTCFASASAVRRDHPEAWPSWTLRALGHEGKKCWYPTTRTSAHDHPSDAKQQTGN
jgi:hypothetical protein